MLAVLVFVEKIRMERGELITEKSKTVRAETKKIKRRIVEILRLFAVQRCIF